MSTHANRQAKTRQGGPDVCASNLFRLDGRTIITLSVTGGGGAMGLNVAAAVLEQGGDVICIDRMDQPLPDLWAKAKELSEKHDGQLWYHSCDTTDTDRILPLFEQAISKTRYPLRGFVACAGVSDGGSSVDFPMDRVKRLLDVNVAGTFACVQAVAKILQRRQDLSASCVLIASMSGHVSNKGVDTAMYNASKSAVLQLTRSLAAEWGSRPGMPLIRVNSISPGYIRTRMTEETLAEPGMEKLWEEDNMLNRLSYADEYRGPTIFLLSDASSFVTGADLKVDGGHTAW